MKKVAVITGGSQGLGRYIVEKMKNNFEVVVLSNDRPSLEETMAELGVTGFFCDVTDLSQIETAIKFIVDRFGAIDILINNAGIWIGGELENTGYNDIAKVLMVNTVGTIYMTKAVIPQMKKQKSGKIINIGSTNGIETKKERSVYAASKWAVMGFSGVMREELQKDRIAVMCLNPGLMSTNLHKNAGAERDYTQAMKPEKVAEIISYICSQDEIVFENIVFRSLEGELF